jgi:hypothetical protein
MRILSVYFAVQFAAVPVVAQALPDHTTFGRVLERHLHGIFVDYAAVKADPDDLDAYLAELAATDEAEVSSAAREAQLAFWINAYNACAVKLVVEHYPIKQPGFPASLVRSLQGVPAISIRQISDTWSREFCRVAGADRSLDQIEHEIIRPMGEPRIHFAVNCASRSCPVLAREPYRPETLDEQLDAAVQRFVADDSQYRLEPGDRPVLHVNKILDWYKDDFGGTDGVIEFLVRYVSDADAALLRSSSLQVKHGDYDWTLNDTAIFGSDR